MITHSVFLPGESQTEEPGRLQSMGLQRVRHDWATEHTQEKLMIFSPNIVSHTGKLFSSRRVGQAFHF